MTLVLMRSPNGGVGTTFLTARLAMALAARGHEVCAVDCTAQDSLKLHFEIAPNQSLEPLNGEATPDAMAGVQLYRWDLGQDAATLSDLLAAHSGVGRVCLVDLGTHAGELRDRLMPHATVEICPLVPTPVALAGLTRVDPARALTMLDRTLFVLNQLDDRRRLSNDIHKLLRALLGEQLLGTVRRDEAVNEALAAMTPLASFAPASAALKDIELLTQHLVERAGLRAAGTLREVAA